MSTLKEVESLHAAAEALELADPNRQTMRVTVELSIGSSQISLPSLWAMMLADQAADPRHRMTLETRSYAVNLKVIEVDQKIATDAA
jgi:hypothetical protein